MILKNITRLLLVALPLTTPVYSQKVREHTRLANPSGTRVSDTQAADVTLTLSTVSRRPIQQIVRVGGTIDKSRQIITAYAHGPEAAMLMVGQRVRSFPPESKSSMFQAKVTRVAAQGDRTLVEVTLSREGPENSRNYVVEITIERSAALAIPNEAIIEEGDKRIVYVKKPSGEYAPQEIQSGFQGELHTEILSGVKEGDEVVTFGSFFVDSDYKLKGTIQSADTNAH